MLSKDMVTGIASSPKHIITRIAFTGSKPVYPLTHTDSKLYNAPSYLFRVSCWLYDASTGWLSHSECQHNARNRRLIGCILQGS